MPYKSIEGLEHIDKVIDIDQSPMGVLHVQIPLPTQVFSVRYATFSPKYPKRKYVATNQVDLVST